MWLNRVFINLANEDQRSYLTTDCSNINKNRPGRHRTNAGNPEEQVCYFNKASNDQVYYTFMSKRIKSGNFEKGIYFKIDRVQSKINKETFSANKTLEKMAQAMIDYQKELENKRNQQMEREEKADVEKLLKTFNTLDSQPDPDFFQDDNNVSKKKTKKYSSTKVKARTLLTNTSYRRFKNEDFDKPTFVVDIMTFLMQNLNPLDLERKLETDTERNHVKMI